jgi:hypothetical protein
MVNLPGDKRFVAKRRWFRFQLRTLLLLVTVCCLVFGFWLSRAERQRRAAAAIRGLGGRVFYDYQWRDGDYVEGGRSTVPEWLLRACGEDAFHSIVAADLGAYFQNDTYDTWPGETTFDEDFHVGQEVWGHLQSLPLEFLSLNACNLRNEELRELVPMRGLKSLQLETVPIDGRGLAHLTALPKLEVLSLHRCGITDDTVDGLLQLHSLRALGLVETRLSPRSVERVKNALPNCRVYD